MKRLVVASVLLPLLALSACGDTWGDRALSGAAIGAGAGGLGGLMFGSPLTGALIGGAVGAGVGAATTNDQFNGGRPAWR
jgi:osmotically inducible lipoprotein OsmB